MKSFLDPGSCPLFRKKKTMPKNPSTAIIKEVYDGDNSPEIFELELEKALENCCDIIIIEPTRLAEETARWIKVGNCLHKTAVFSGISSICISNSSQILLTETNFAFVQYRYCSTDVALYRNHCTICIPLTVASVFCAGLYMISWQFDPCCKYQVAKSLEKLNTTEFSPETLYLSLLGTTMDSYSGSPVILIRKDDTVRKIFHTAVALIAFTLTVFRAFK